MSGQEEPGPATCWALVVDRLGVRLLAVIECQGTGQPPALHRLVSTALSGSPERSLALSGWHAISGWQRRSWGHLVAVEPGPEPDR